jgi:hypothetical protein
MAFVSAVLLGRGPRGKRGMPSTVDYLQRQNAEMCDALMTMFESALVSAGTSYRR